MSGLTSLIDAESVVDSIQRYKTGIAVLITTLAYTGMISMSNGDAIIIDEFDNVVESIRSYIDQKIAWYRLDRVLDALNDIDTST